MKKVRILGPVLRNVPIGATVRLPDAKADAFIAGGFAQEVTEAVKPKPAAKDAPAANGG